MPIKIINYVRNWNRKFKYTIWQYNALKNINLKIEEKTIPGHIGPNGGGKSTLLKAILGLINPVSGSIKILGRSPQDANGLIGYVPQFTHFW